MRRFFVVAIAVCVLCAPAAAPAFAADGASPAGTLDAAASGSGSAPLSGMLIGGGGSPVATQPMPSAAGTGMAGKMIEISLATQTMTVWENGRAVMRFLISTGRPGYRTPKGRFKVRAKGTRWWSKKWKVWMPYALNFHANYNLHSLPHYPGSRHLIGASTLGRPASHGCVRIGPANARRLYSWTRIGTPVWIH